jgi:GTP pyrophosphokinase
MEMFQDQVFCFTPKGDLIALPRGACPVDFAYAVHSAVGDHCVGAKINGRMLPLRTPLNNGDQVEIVTSKAQTPNPTWDRFVVTGRAKARIRRFVRIQQRLQYADLGRAILTRAFKQEGYDFTEKGLEGVLKIFKVAALEDLLVLVGDGSFTGREVVVAVYPELKTQPQKDPSDNVVSLKRGKKTPATPSVPIKGLIPGMAMHYAGCCHPLPGDRIVGIVTTGKGVTIHTIDCDMLEQYAETPERWLDLSWNQEDQDVRVGRVNLVVANEAGSLGNLSMVIAKNQGNISNLKITNRNADFFEMMVDIEVRDVKHLTNIMAALRATPAINSVERARN